MRVIGIEGGAWRFPKPHYAILLISKRPALVPVGKTICQLERWSHFLGKYLSNWQPPRYSFLILYHVLMLTLQRGVSKGSFIKNTKESQPVTSLQFVLYVLYHEKCCQPLLWFLSWELCTQLLFNHVLWVVFPLKCHIYHPVALNVLLWYTDDPELRFSV